MRRRIANFAVMVSAALCVVTVALLVRSLFVWDRVNRHELTDLGGDWRRQWVRLDSSAGRLDVNFLRETRSNREQLAYLQANAKPFAYYTREGKNPVPTINPFLRFVGMYGQVDDKPNSFFVRLVFPYWLVALAMAIAPVRRVWTRAGRRAAVRRGLNQCVRCGYDLRATPDRCPECGTESAGGALPARARSLA